MSLLHIFKAPCLYFLKTNNSIFILLPIQKGKFTYNQENKTGSFHFTEQDIWISPWYKFRSDLFPFGSFPSLQDSQQEALLSRLHLILNRLICLFSHLIGEKAMLVTCLLSWKRRKWKTYRKSEIVLCKGNGFPKFATFFTSRKQVCLGCFFFFFPKKLKKAWAISFTHPVGIGICFSSLSTILQVMVAPTEILAHWLPSVLCGTIINVCWGNQAENCEIPHVNLY